MTSVFAHRGAHLSERENTLGAFRDAVALGVAGVELDVRRTKDGVLVVHHDPVIDGVALAHTRARDLPPYVPTLEAAMNVLAGVTVNVEIKNSKSVKEPTYDDTGAFVREVLDFLHGAGVASSVIISCFDLTTCAQVRDYDLEMPVGWLIWDVLLESALIKAHVLGLNAVNPYFTLVSAEAQRQAIDLGLDLNVWTVSEPGDIAAMVALGVASIITDQPALALRLVAKETA
ncbi:MAG TPA: glycerophosphodiester phosphodiesterase [Acidimicrobiales bacterium]|nr:glycerophosphodiester phosphodiesterase [Acidimicrobiales bacterium]